MGISPTGVPISPNVISNWRPGKETPEPGHTSSCESSSLRWQRPSEQNMPRVVPSQIVSLINESFPGTENRPDFPIYSSSAGVLSAIVRLTNEIPTELLTIGAADYSDLVCASEGLTSAIDRWLQRGGDDPP